MPVLQDRVQETTTTGGTGTITLAGAVTGYRSFAQAFSIGDITYYTIDNGSGEWEIGVGTVGSGTLSRDSVLESSNSNALVNFSAGTKRVFCSAPTKVLLPDETGNSGKVLTTNGTDPSWTTTLNGMTIGNITPGSGAFTTLSASSTVSGTGFSTYLASPPAIGGTTPAAGSFTTLSSTGNTTLGDASGDTLTINAGTTTFAQGTANGVLYLNGSKVATSGSGLVFDGTNFGVGTSSPKAYLQVGSGSITPSSATGATIQHPYTPILSLLAPSATAASARVTFGTELSTQAASILYTNSTGILQISSSGGSTSGNIAFSSQGSEVMRLTYTGLGIGTSSPTKQLHLYAATPEIMLENSGGNDWVIKNYQGKFLLNDATTGQDRFILDSSGNVGIGTSSPSQKLELVGDIQQQNANYLRGKNSSGTATRLFGLNGANTLYIGSIDADHTGGTLFVKNGSAQMLLDSSGNLGLGVTPSVKCHIQGSQYVQLRIDSTLTQANLALYSQYDSGGTTRNWAIVSNVIQYGDLVIKQSNSQGGDPLTGTERLILNASGALLLGKTSSGAAGTGVGIYPGGSVETTVPNSTGYHMVFNTGGASPTTAGSVYSATSNTVNYNTSSDQRLKTNINPAGSAVQSILDFPVDQFDWISDDSHVDFGAVAQKAINVIPEMVSVPEDPEEMWGIDWSKAVPRLIRAYQELHAEIELLKAKVN